MAKWTQVTLWGNRDLDKRINTCIVFTPPHEGWLQKTELHRALRTDQYKPKHCFFFFPTYTSAYIWCTGPVCRSSSPPHAVKIARPYWISPSAPARKKHKKCAEVNTSAELSRFVREKVQKSVLLITNTALMCFNGKTSEHWSVTTFPQ